MSQTLHDHLSRLACLFAADPRGFSCGTPGPPHKAGLLGLLATWTTAQQCSARRPATSRPRSRRPRAGPWTLVVCSSDRDSGETKNPDQRKACGAAQRANLSVVLHGKRDVFHLRAPCLCMEQEHETSAGMSQTKCTTVLDGAHALLFWDPDMIVATTMLETHGSAMVSQSPCKQSWRSWYSASYDQQPKHG